MGTVFWQRNLSHCGLKERKLWITIGDFHQSSFLTNQKLKVNSVMDIHTPTYGNPILQFSHWSHKHFLRLIQYRCTFKVFMLVFCFYGCRYLERYKFGSINLAVFGNLQLISHTSFSHSSFCAFVLYKDAILNELKTIIMCGSMSFPELS